MPFIVEDVQTVHEVVDGVATIPAVPEVSAAPEVNPREVLSQLYNGCTVGKNVEERKANSVPFAKKVVASLGSVQNAFVQADLMAHLNKSFLDKKNAAVKEGMYCALSSLATLGHTALPYLIPTLPMIFEGLADKQKNVPKLARAALAAVLELVNTDGALVNAVLPFMLPLLQSEKTAWQAKVGVLQTITAFAKAFPVYVDKRLPELIPVVALNIWDSHPDVARNASASLSAICYTVTNADLHKFIPVLVAAIKEPNNVAETVFQLAATTFVTAVEAPSLAIMAPILSRGLAEPARATLRQAAVIVDNMCKLVEDPVHAEQFLPKILPPLNRVIATAADPELRDVATKAKATLVRVGGGKEDIVIVTEAEKAQIALNATMAIMKNMCNNQLDNATMIVVATICNALDEVRDYSEASWAKMTPFLVAADLQSMTETLRAHFIDVNVKRGIKIIEKDESEGEELCNCEFSLAYGGMILLSNTTLRLTRGQRYGLCGPNGSGKTTLMRAIANGQVEGFPPADVLKTVFVEHNLQASDAQKSVIEFLLTDPVFKGKDSKKIIETLLSVGFDDEKQAMAVGALSGGWKMKLELARAMLMEADILLLDEPTNHLDVRNIAWLTSYLQSLKNVTSIIVSHDSSFLDDVCSHIVHYEHRKLKTYKGNLSEFVKVKPEAKSYYDLISSPFSFKFPEPGFLEGIKSKDKAILTMKGVSFQYPNTPKPTVTGVTVQCSLSSRVSILGPNGAGKSTVIKVLTGETEPTSGDVWKHPTLNVAYVAQHAFHHIEQHLDKTPSEYIRWRYETGEDREIASKITRQLTPEEQAKLHQIIVIDGEKRRIEKIMGRRMTKRVFEYDIKWEGKSWDDNTWMSRTKLEDLGLEKYLKIYDDKESAREGLYQRPLTSANISKHLADIGLEDKFTSHSRIRGLSGGQKVKVVIGAAMWNNPHILVLDEPTNYLDRDSLGALASAIKDYGGGVIMVTHHTEFSQALCEETWNLEDGKLTVAGNTMPAIIEKIEQKEILEGTDAFGNTIKLKSTRTLSRKERLQKEKRRAMKIKNGEPLDSDDELD